MPGEEFVNPLPPFCEPEGSPMPEPSSARKDDSSPGGASSSFGGESTPMPAAVSREATSCVEEVLAYGSSAYCASSKKRLEEERQQ